MEPLLIVLGFGLFGGLGVSLLIARNRRATPPTFVSRRLEAPTPALINMAHIRVEGIGGLGMLAAVVAVAVADPRIRVAILIAFVLGGGLALALIAWRRRGGPLHSSGSDPDDRLMLHIDSDRRRKSSAAESGDRDASACLASPNLDEDWLRIAW